MCACVCVFGREGFWKSWLLGNWVIVPFYNTEYTMKYQSVTKVFFPIWIIMCLCHSGQLYACVGWLTFNHRIQIHAPVLGSITFKHHPADVTLEQDAEPHQLRGLDPALWPHWGGGKTKRGFPQGTHYIIMYGVGGGAKFCQVKWHQMASSKAYRVAYILQSCLESEWSQFCLHLAGEMIVFEKWALLFNMPIYLHFTSEKCQAAVGTAAWMTDRYGIDASCGIPIMLSSDVCHVPFSVLLIHYL